MSAIKNPQETERRKIVKERAIDVLEELIDQIENGNFSGYFLISPNGEEPYDFFCDPSKQAAWRASKCVGSFRLLIEDELECQKAYV